jgi:chromosome segregation ATPase
MAAAIEVVSYDEVKIDGRNVGRLIDVIHNYPQHLPAIDAAVKAFVQRQQGIQDARHEELASALTAQKDEEVRAALAAQKNDHDAKIEALAESHEAQVAELTAQASTAEAERDALGTKPEAQEIMRKNRLAAIEKQREALDKEAQALREQGPAAGQ